MISWYRVAPPICLLLADHVWTSQGLSQGDFEKRGSSKHQLPLRGVDENGTYQTAFSIANHGPLDRLGYARQRLMPIVRKQNVAQTISVSSDGQLEPLLSAALPNVTSGERSIQTVSISYDAYLEHQGSSFVRRKGTQQPVEVHDVAENSGSFVDSSFTSIEKPASLVRRKVTQQPLEVQGVAENGGSFVESSFASSAHRHEQPKGIRLSAKAELREQNEPGAHPKIVESAHSHATRNSSLFERRRAYVDGASSLICWTSKLEDLLLGLAIAIITFMLVLIICEVFLTRSGASQAHLLGLRAHLCEILRIGSEVCESLFVRLGLLEQQDSAELSDTEAEGDDWDATEVVSIKLEIARRIPMINDASSFREARQLFQKLGGVQALQEELENLGVVDEATQELTTRDTPFNVFAWMAAGKKTQEDMEPEQDALGEYRKRFLVCKNLKERDDLWNSTQAEAMRIASMSQKHRMLTTKDLHWQWFNPLVFGLVPQKEGGAGKKGAVEELTSIKAAALQYAKNVGGYSDEVGIYLHCYGHSETSALLVHILDMAKLGPSFKLHGYKNCHIDAILEVLCEEVAGKEFYWENDEEKSIKLKLAEQAPSINSPATFREARRLLHAMGGAEVLKEELVSLGYIDSNSSKLTHGETPFNIFARLASGVQTQADMAAEQSALGKFQSKYLVCCNRKENDLNWNSRDPKKIRTASMSRRHRILTTKDLHWQWFNVLVFGIVPVSDGGVSKVHAVEELEEMKAAAYEYTSNIGGWPSDVGLFFNCYGHSEVHSLFLHIIDMTELGPGFKIHRNKNCSLDAALEVLREEAIEDDGSSDNDEERSVKFEIARQLPAINNASTFRKARALLKELGGATAVRDELISLGFVDAATGQLTTGETPFNPFARMAKGLLMQDGMESEQAALGEYQSRFLICRNREESDLNWNTTNPKKLPTASMCRRHRILTRKNLDWNWFNPLVFGMVHMSEDGADISAALEELESIKSAALQYTSNSDGWSKNISICMNCYGLSQVNALFVHVLDMSEPGPGFRYQSYKTLKVDTIIEVFRGEAAEN